jgi:DNA-binding response OmpR family regulator
MNDQAAKLLAGNTDVCAMLGRTGLIGETVLVVESDSGSAEALQEVLERAGAEALIAPTAVEALSRIAQFEFSSAVVEWCPDMREHRSLVHWLREDGVPLLYRADVLPHTGATAAGSPVLPKSAPLHEVVAALARIGAVARAAEVGTA